MTKVRATITINYDIPDDGYDNMSLEESIAVDLKNFSDEPGLMLDLDDVSITLEVVDD